jgi:hypothetical protein
VWPRSWRSPTGRTSRQQLRNVTAYAYGVLVSELAPTAQCPLPLRTFQVTVTLPRPDGDHELFPPGGQAAVELAAAAIGAGGLLTAWTGTQSTISMTVELRSVARCPGSRSLGGTGA